MKSGYPAKEQNTTSFLCKSSRIELLICNMFGSEEGGPHETAENIDPSAFWTLRSFLGYG